MKDEQHKNASVNCLPLRTWNAVERLRKAQQRDFESVKISLGVDALERNRDAGSVANHLLILEGRPRSEQAIVQPMSEVSSGP